MALNTTLSFEQVDKTGRVITLSETTGFYKESTNPGGYGGPNISPSALQSKLITLSKHQSSVVHSTKFVRVLTNINSNEYASPNIDQISAGVKIELTSIHLGITKPLAGIADFAEGVYDINLYSLLAALPGTIVTGNRYIYGSGFGNIYEYDSVIVAGEIYQIDKTMDTNGGTVIYLIEELKDDASEFNPAYRANAKALIDVRTVRLLNQTYANMSIRRRCSEDTSKELETVSECFDYLAAANDLFYEGSYGKSDELVNGAYSLLNNLQKCR